MKSTFAFFVAALLAVPTITKAVVIDGSAADAQYGSAIVSQQLGTSTYKNTETNIDAAGGSELDAAYGFVSNGVLYLVFAGNLDSGGTDSLENPYDKLNIFFMTGPGGDHTLGTNYNGAADFGHLNTMGVGGNGAEPGDPGFTFDTGFAANYWIGATVGGAGVGPSLYVNREVICSNCDGEYLGSAVPSNAPPGNIMVDPVFGVQAALNNSNTNGVQMDVSGCYANGAPFNPQNVKTGLELAIPLSAIGSPTGSVSICAFITDDQYDSVYNQILAPINGGTLECQGSFGDSSAVDLSTLPGQHFFTLAVPPCNSFLLTPTAVEFPSSGGSSNVTVVDSGGCSWTASSTQPWVTITGVSSSTINYSVASNTTVDARTASLIVSGQFATASVTITEDGILLPPLGSIIIDGIAEPAYGCPVAVQQLATQFGKNLSTNLVNNGGGTLQGGGSELDAAYGLVLNNVLYLTLAGNLQNNGNEVMIFFMTGPGGQNTLTNVNPNIGSLNSSGPTNGYGPGLTFDPGFAPNYWLGANASGATFFIDYAQLWPGSTNALGVATNGYYVGSTSTTNGTLSGIGNFNPYGIQATLNDSNTNGVSGGTCTTNAVGASQTIAAAQVRSGLEFAIPLGAIGNPTGAVAICAYITGSGNHTYLSNQILGPIGNNNPAVPVCQSNFGPVTNSPAINFGTLPGQHFFYVGPEVRVTSIGVTNKNVNISYQTENNTNLLYRVERTLGNLATNSVWTPISGFTNGTGGIILQTDPFGGTNKPDALYRIRQTPQCQ